MPLSYDLAEEVVLLLMAICSAELEDRAASLRTTWHDAASHR